MGLICKNMFVILLDKLDSKPFKNIPRLQSQFIKIKEVEERFGLLSDKDQAYTLMKIVTIERIGSSSGLIDFTQFLVKKRLE